MRGKYFKTTERTQTTERNDQSPSLRGRWECSGGGKEV